MLMSLTLFHFTQSTTKTKKLELKLQYIFSIAHQTNTFVTTQFSFNEKFSWLSKRILTILSGSINDVNDNQNDNNNLLGKSLVDIVVRIYRVTC